MTTTPALLYDADCGFCSAVARRLPRLRLAAEVVAMQAVDLPALGVDAGRALTEMPFVEATGRVTYGHRAWATALRHSAPVLRPLGPVLDHWPVEPVARRVYAWVSSHRHLMPGGTAACSLPRT